MAFDASPFPPGTDQKAVGRFLLIVARDDPDLYKDLEHTFSTEKNMRVILDRRVGERRQNPYRHEPERRRADRRRQAEIDQKLRFIGWVISRQQDHAAGDQAE